ncbi:MAG: hypothetical protein HY242_00370 [Afipia sp.]|nr:hypothetical protein [Afipia sp.]
MDEQVFEPLPVRYTGLFADSHLVDANQFGRSISGIARIGNSVCNVLFFSEIGVPKKFQIKFYVRPAKKNGLLQELVAVMNSGSMPMFHPALLKIGGIFVEKAFDAIINTALGRNREAALAIEKMHDLARENIEFGKQVHEGQMRDKAWLQGMIEGLVVHNRGALKELPAPIGRTVRQVQIGAPSIGPTVDEAAAEVLRATEPLQLGDTQEYEVLVEGVFKTNGACRLRLMPDDRVVAGKITDPALTVPGSVYTSALDQGLPLHITAKPTLKDGEVHSLYVSDAKIAR